MYSTELIKEFASALVRSAIRPEGLAMTGAMLVCAAIVLNLGPFGRKPAPVVTAAQRTPSFAVAAQRSEPRTVVPVVAAAAPPAALLAPEPLELIAYQGGPAAAVIQAVEEPVQAEAPAAEAAPSPPPETAPVAVAEPAPEPEPAPTPAIFGVWAPDAGVCSARSFQDGVLPTVINAEGAWAGETFCIFSNLHETDTGWRVVAKCMNSRSRWTSNVRLTVKDDRLTWTSRRGTQVYTRCTPDTLMAQAR